VAFLVEPIGLAWPWNGKIRFRMVATKGLRILVFDQVPLVDDFLEDENVNIGVIGILWIRTEAAAAASDIVIVVAQTLTRNPQLAHHVIRDLIDGLETGNVAHGQKRECQTVQAAM
jgi:hypothetical protein